MTDATHTGNKYFHTPQHLLAGCLLASIAVHGVVLVWLPGWQHQAVEAPAPVLDVVLVAAAQADVAETTPVALAAAAPQRRMNPQPSEPLPRTTLPAPATPPQTVTDAAVAVASPEAPRVAVESRASAVRVESATPPLFNAAYLRNPAPVYPAIARRSGDEGTVMLKVLVSPEGAPVRVELDQSSGSKSLDGAALESVKGWRFVPARRGTQNIEAWVRVPVVFRLES